MSSHVALDIGTIKATSQFFESKRGRYHRSSLQQSPVQVHRKATHVKLLERNLKDVSLEELVAVAGRVKTPTVAVLRLFVTAKESQEVNDRFTLLDRKTTQACLHFSRALAQAIGGWLQQLELGLRLWNRELKLLAEALCCTKSLRRLSFANSGLGDTRFQILAKSIRECAPLHTLNLSGCYLTDLSVPYIVSIVKGSPNGERAKPEEEHNPGQLTPEQALACQLKLRKAQKASQEWSSRQFPLQGKWAPAASVENGQKAADWQASLRQSGPLHSTCIPSKEMSAGAPGLRSLDLSHNQFTDDLADELCPVLYEDAPLSALHLQSNQLTREGAKTFEAVMKERRVLQLVDLRDNKQEVVPHSADYVAAAGARSIPCPIYPKEYSKPATNKYRQNFLAKPKHVSNQKKTKPLEVSASPGNNLVAINKLPLRPKSAPECKFSGQTNLFTSRRMEASESGPNTARSLRSKPIMRQMRESSTSRPRSAPDRLRMPPRKTSRGKAYFKNPRFGESVNKVVADEIAPWEDGKPVKPAHASKTREVSEPTGMRVKKRKSRSQNFQFPNSRRATFRTVTSLVPHLGSKNCPEKQKRKPKVKPNVVKRMELLFPSGKQAAVVPSAEEVPAKTPPSAKGADATEQEESHEWNNFMSEMTKSLLSLGGSRLPHLAEVVQTQV